MLRKKFVLITSLHAALLALSVYHSHILPLLTWLNKWHTKYRPNTRVASDPKCFTYDVAVHRFWWLTASFSHIKTLPHLHGVLPSIRCFHPCRAELALQRGRTGTQGPEPSIQLTPQACTNCHSGTQLARPSNAPLTPLHASPAPSAPGRPQCLSTMALMPFSSLLSPV